MNNVVLAQAKKSIILCAALAVFLLPNLAQAFFSDTETSPQQQFQASELQLETTLTQSAVAIGVDQAAATTSLAVNTSAQSVPAVFDVTTVDVAGDVAFCDNLQLQTSNGLVTAQAVLPAFTTLEQATFGEYELAVSFVDGGLVTAGQVCVVTLAVTAWQQNMSKGSGYQDIAQYELTITATELSVQRQAAPLLLGGTEDDSTNTAPIKAEPASASTEPDSGGDDGSADSVPTPNVGGAGDESAESAAAEGSETTSPAPKDPATEAKKQPEPPSEPVTEPEDEADKPTESSAPVTPDEDPAADDTPVKQEEPPAPEDEAEPGSTEVANEEINQPPKPEPEPEQTVTKPEPEPVAPPETSTDDAASESVTEPEPAVVKEEVANESS